MALALVYQQRYETTGDEALFNAAVRELNTLHEIEPRDPRAGSIMQNLLQIRQAKQRAAAGRTPQ
jgi:hypothetical protein